MANFNPINLQFTPTPIHQHFQDKRNPIITTLASYTSILGIPHQHAITPQFVPPPNHPPPPTPIHMSPTSPINTSTQFIYPIPETNIQAFLTKFKK